MKNRGKKLAAILGAVALVICQNGVLEVRAEEPQASQESPLQEGTDGKTDDTAKETENLESNETPDSKNGETNTEQTQNQEVEAEGTEKKIDESAEKTPDNEVVKEEEPDAVSDTTPEENVPEVTAEEPETIETTSDTRATEILAVTDLKWEYGKAVFYNPNDCKVRFEVHLFKDGAYPGGVTTGNSNVTAEKSGKVSVDLNYFIEKYGEGTYTYKVVTYADGIEPDHSLTSGKGTVSGEKSEAYVYPNSDSESQQISASTILVWRNDQETGMAYFNNPNGKGARYQVTVYRDDVKIGDYPSAYESDDYVGVEYIPLYFFEWAITESGSYKFEVETFKADGTFVGSANSDSFQYTKPEEKLSVPDRISWSKEGIISCDGPDEEYLEKYSFRVIHRGKPLTMFGSNWVSNYVNVQIRNGHMEFNLNELLKAAYGVTPVNGDSVRIRAVSSDSAKCFHSEWSAAVTYNNGDLSDEEGSDNDSEGEDGEKSSSEESVVVEEWKPTTPDEIKRYAVYSREKVEYTTDKENAYSVTINNAMQGKQCFDSFEAVLGDWTIGRTYNILPAGKAVYKMNSKASIVLNIPKALQKEGREFRMICVTEKGRPILLEDLDTNPGTITFETDTYYAFALIYRDTVAK